MQAMRLSGVGPILECNDGVIIKYKWTPTF